MVTIVPAGSAASVPYLVYLARGRDVVRPPCVVLLGDSAGNDAAKALAEVVRRRELISPEQQIESWTKSVDLALDSGVVVKELEDFIPVSVAAEVAREYATKVVGLSRDAANALAADDIEQLGDKDGSVFDAVAGGTERLGEEFHIEKVGFAKGVAELVQASRVAPREVVDCEELARRFNALLAHLAKLLRDARALKMNGCRATTGGGAADHPTTTIASGAELGGG